MITEFHPEAADEYDWAVSYYAKINPKVAAQFIEEMERCIQLAAEAPNRWKRFG
jgi:plasmid stabilization system protein ParE